MTDWDRLNTMKDADIDTSGIPLLTESFFNSAELWLPDPQNVITMRIDPDVLAWFKQQGEGYETRINAVLRLYMEAHLAES